MTPRDVINDVRQLLKGEPVFLAGSLVAADAHGHSDFHDVDLFCPTPHVLVAMGQKLQMLGFKVDSRMERTWHRWLRYGFKQWHTNSLRLNSPDGIEYNLVYKLTDGHPTTSLAQVLESFDFGLLGMGWDIETDTFRDLRPYLFPQYAISGSASLYTGPLPMMPAKRDNWRAGFISTYNGLREVGRYAKYHGYGYDLSLVKDDLVHGYRMAALYFSTHWDDEQKKLSTIYDTIARHMEADNIDHLKQAAQQIEYKDSFDVIMEALE